MAAKPKVCFQTTIDFDIQLQQNRSTKLFTVVYGRQVDENLTYADAAKKLGQAIMHALACQSKLDNEGP